MRKKQVLPLAIGAIIVIALIMFCKTGGGLRVDYSPVTTHKHKACKYDLKVYVENSGSMDGYMCPGSDLQDAVFDYVSDLQKGASTASFYYINSSVIPVNKNLNDYIKALTPQSFAMAGGNRGNTDLMQIFNNILSAQENNTVTVFVSDCILDLPGGDPTAFFGRCTVSMKSDFNDALSANPNLGVEVLKMESKFDGMWYCGNERAKLSGVKRPYYIWVIGDRCILAQLNKKYPVNDIQSGVKDYCAFTGTMAIPFEVEQKKLTTPRGGKCKIQILADLGESLQAADAIKNNARGSDVLSVTVVKGGKSQYSHVVTVAEDPNPHHVTLNFNQPAVPAWVAASSDDTGKNVESNLDKTTGFKYLIEGVAKAYKGADNFGSISFDVKDK